MMIYRSGILIQKQVVTRAGLNVSAARLNRQNEVRESAMFFVCNLQSVSQAECRRFDPGLPLHKINEIQRDPKTSAPFLLQLHDDQAFLQLIDRRKPVLDRRLRVHVLVHIEAVAELIGDQLPIHPERFH